MSLPFLSRSACALDTAVLLLVVNLLSRNLGNLGPEHARLYALLALLALLLVRLPWPMRLASSRALGVGAGASMLALTALYASPRVEVWLAALPVLVYGLDRLLAGVGGDLVGRLTYLYGTLLYALLWLVCQGIPAVWLEVRAMSLGWSGLVGRYLVKQPLVLGPSATGFWIFASFACYLIARAVLARTAVRARMIGLAGALALLLGLGALYLYLQNQPGLFSQGAGPLFNSLFLYFLLGLGVVLWGAPKTSAAPSQARGRAWLLPLLAGAYALALTLYPVTARDGARTVYLLDDGFVDWDRPVFGKYGPYETGMFGSLLDYLHLLGYRTRVDAHLSPQNLAGVDVLVIINPTRDWSREEYQAVWSFVRRGGSLLVLGDHTDIAGTRGSLDRLLRPVNIGFFFDSAYPSKPGWRDSLALHLHPVNLGVSRATEVVISVGASLAVADPAFPVVVGRYGFSDLGNMLNAQGAFLGNYHYEKGEQLGDVVLTAGAFLGDGKVLVFGDTSPFQNTAIAFDLTFVHNVFQWLTADRWSGGQYLRYLAVPLLLALGFGLLRWRPTAAVTASCALALTAGLGAGLVIDQAGLPATRLDGPLALVDRAHGNRLSLAPLETDSLGGLLTNLLRNGYLPVLMNTFSADLLERADVLVVIAPTRAYGQSELAELDRFMKRGGHVILAAGWEEKSPSLQPLLDLIGMDLLRIPLGPEPVIRKQEHLTDRAQFINAWPVTVRHPEQLPLLQVAQRRYRPFDAGGSPPERYTPAPEEPLATPARPAVIPKLGSLAFEQGLLGPVETPRPVSLAAGQPVLLSSHGVATRRPEISSPPWTTDVDTGATRDFEVLYQTDTGLPVVVLRRMGKGGAVLVGDTYFFGNSNLENLNYYRKGNILFLKRLFESFRSAP